ncbi:methyltransferase domain-containing protein [Kribbella sp. NPDC051952]|uniref:class I SAM-dependent methyltransferase n=1 Tax=Kribbella sp. NPDC051952 TaxID=3154851 RepID=UPI0034289C55
MTSTDTAWVAPANADQLTAWDTAEGVFWAEHAELFEHSLQRYDDWLLRAAGIRDGDQVLDVGCGTGSTTRSAAWLAGSGTALGVDLSSPMLTVAALRARDAGTGNATYLQADAQVHPFEPEAYDVLLSRTGCMFFGDQVEAFTNLARAVKPGGRLSLLVWQPPSQNPWFTELTTALAVGRTLPSPPPDAPSPFALADPARIAQILTAAGFATPECEPVKERMYWGPDVPTAVDFVLGVLGWLLDDLDPDELTRAMTNLRRTLVSHYSAGGVTFPSAAWLVTTRKPA